MFLRSQDVGLAASSGARGSLSRPREAIAALCRGELRIPAEYSRSFAHLDTLRLFYSTRDFQPLWIGTPERRSLIPSILSFFLRAEEHGLPSALYQPGQLMKMVEASDARSGIEDGNASEDAVLDMLLSDRLIDYARHLRYGVVNPRVVETDPNFLPLKDGSRADLFAPLRTPSIQKFLESIAPKERRYLELQEALRFYRSIAASGGWAAIPPMGAEKTEPGQYYQGVRQLIDRLVKTHPQMWKNFRRAGIGNRLPDSIVRSTILSTVPGSAISRGVYDSSIAALMREFQARNGLLPDGVLGKRTVQQINATVGERILQIQLNLERFRWMQYPDTGRYIMVNIPDFYLYAVENDTLREKIKVCAGAWYDRRYYTPLLHGVFSYITLNPSWWVPSSIVERELYPEAAKNPEYLRRRRYQVLMKDSVVSSSSIDWKKYSAKNLPFRIVQQPGGGNALGRIKFGFYNPFDIYLHDTPRRTPFENANRGVSHGCVRVEKPDALLHFLIDGHSQWDVPKVREYLASTRSTKSIRPERKVPLYIDYFTAWVDANGDIQFRDDVYGRDRRLRKVFLAGLNGLSLSSPTSAR